MKVNCYFLIVILQCTIVKDLGDSISNKNSEKSKTFSELKNNSDIFEHSKNYFEMQIPHENGLINNIYTFDNCVGLTEFTFSHLKFSL